MPRPRFYKLPEEKRSAILRVAAEEFAENGFDGTSYNSIIARSGVSKGAMYYYFDDKQDLFATVLGDSIGQLLKTLGGPSRESRTAEAFWGELEAMLLRGLDYWREQPTLAGLVRGMTQLGTAPAAPDSPLADLWDELLRWTRELVETGQRVGGVRSDVPQDLLVQMFLGFGQTIDLWFAENWEQLAPTEAERLARVCTDMWRRMSEPTPEGA